MDRNPTPKPRHYATIGIGDVFLEPPKHRLPKSYLLGNDAGKVASFVSSEIVGAIKETPEDFLVREIAKKGRVIPGMTSDAERQAFQVADIVSIVDDQTDESPKKNHNEMPKSDNQNTTENETRAENQQENESDHQVDVINDIKDETPSQETASKGQAIQDAEPTPTIELPPRELLEAVLLELVPDHDEIIVSDILASLQSLEKQSVERMANISNPTPEEEEQETEKAVPGGVFIPAIPPNFSHLEKPGVLSGVDRRAFHEAFRLTFPLLKCETVPENNNKVMVTADDFFDDLIPLLYNPREDLPIFYRFHKRGCVSAPQTGNGRHHGKSKEGKRKRDRDLPDDPTASGEPILRLRPDLSKDDRRPIHHLIAQKNRSFQTRTLSNYVLDPKSKEITTTRGTAIQVHWAFGAVKRARKKFKPNNGGRNNGSTSSKESDPTPNTICVLKKREKEHLTAITALCSAVKCRTGDVGLAGIKDMKAVTYQFCTLRNVGIGRLRRAIPNLKRKGIEIGTMRKVGFMLQNGDLQGNRFGITLKGVKRVHIERNEKDDLVEQFRPCEKEHLREMFQRVQRSGFVNFYGEQRVGAPGETSEVGVRTFDVGRAMLQGDFSKAIDLLMTGRAILHSRDAKENPPETRVREAWKESNGDPVATLKVFPKNDNMPRERAVMKGLKRYGKAEPLAAIQCLPHNVRRFWINAYQSWIWNSMASARLIRYGSASPVIGDLFTEDGATDINDVKVVDSENFSSVSLNQVVLPLPGFGVRYPENEIGDAYRRLLDEDNISFEKKGPDEGTAKGAYRHLVTKAEEMELTFQDDKNEALCASSITVSFDLPAGSYATMLLREFLGKTVARD